MSSQATIPLREYLRRTYRPDLDFLEGELRGRHLGERPHALLHAYLVRKLTAFETVCSARVVASPRLHVRHNRVRVPDACVVARSAYRNRVIGKPPLLCVEVFSSNETLEEMAERISDYVEMGVGSVWAVDPWTRVSYVYANGALTAPLDGVLRVPNTPIKVRLEGLFAQLDREHAS